MNKTIEKIKNNLGNSSDIVDRKINNIYYIYLESVSSDDKISNFLNKSITNISTTNDLFKYLKNNIYNSHISILSDINECYYYLAAGYTCIFTLGNKEYIVVETKSSLDRGITEASSEPIIRGPKDSFGENHATNLGLIRKRIKNKNLWIKDFNIGKYTKTKVSIVYINEIALKKNINDIESILSNINIDGILDSGYIRDFIEKDYKTSFPLTISTERPDLTCQNLLNGKIVILVENSPIALIIPATLNDFIKSPEDYYQKATNSTFSRIIRCIAFIITILTPSLYIALMTFNQEMIPDQLLISLAGQRSQVPFPTFIEVLIFIVTFEILREADIRSPSISGASMSIVGALVVGEAAVSAGIVSPIVIIVVAITSICELVFCDVDIINAIRYWRLLFIFSTIFTGIIGIVSACLILIIKLASIQTFNTPYLSPISPLSKNIIKDGLSIESAKNRNIRPNYLTKNIQKVGK